MLQYFLPLCACTFAYCSQVPQRVHLSQHEWNECEHFLGSQANNFFRRGENSIDQGPGHPCVIERDPENNRVYVHLDGKEDSLIGVGGFKRVTQSILWGKSPALVARCQGSSSLLREAEILSKLHKALGIVHMKSFLRSQNGTYGLVLEYCNEGSLRGIEDGTLKMTERELVSIFQELIAGLKSLHEAGYVHRDLHRGNVLMHRKGGVLHASLTDFGLALKMNEEPDAKVSIQGASCPPEVLVKPNRSIDRKKAECYALGVLLHYALFKERPSWCQKMWSSQKHHPSARKKLQLHRLIHLRYKVALDRLKALSGVRKELATLVFQLLDPECKQRMNLDEASRKIKLIAKKWNIKTGGSHGT